MNAGETLTFSYTITNTGTSNLSSVTVTDPLITVVGSPINLPIGQQDTISYTGNYQITQADVDAGEVNVQSTVTSLDPSLNVITDQSSTSLNPTGNDVLTIPIEQTASIQLVKVGVLSGSGVVGDTIDYSFSVSNSGNVTLSGVQVVDAGAVVSGGPITLAPGQTDLITFTGTYTIQTSDVTNQSVTNTATVNASSPIGPVQDGDTSTVDFDQFITRQSTTGILESFTGEDVSDSFTLNCGGTNYRWQIRIDNPLDPNDLANGNWIDHPAADGLQTIPVTIAVAGLPDSAPPGSQTGLTDLDHAFTFGVRGSCDGGVSWTAEVLTVVLYNHIDEGNL